MQISALTLEHLQFGRRHFPRLTFVTSPVVTVRGDPDLGGD